MNDLARVLRQYGAQAVRAGCGLLVSLDQEADTARAHVTVVGGWTRGQPLYARGRERSRRCQATNVDVTALRLIAYLRRWPLGHEPPARPARLRNPSRTGWRRRQGAQLDVRVGGRW